MPQDIFLVVCLNPTLQKTLVLKELIPGEVNRAVRHRLDSSGKGVNVARVLLQLGARVTHLTQAGGWNGPLFLDLARFDGLDIVPVQTSSGIRFCHTLIDTASGKITEIVEEGVGVDDGTDDAIRAAFARLLAVSHTVIISGTRAPGFSPDLYPWMVRTAKEAGRRVIADFRGQDLVDSLPYFPDVIKPNMSEFVSTFMPGRNVMESGADEGLVKDAGSRMLEISSEYACAVVCTHGSNDILAAHGGRLSRIPVEKMEAVNTIGCGDAFTAGMADALYKGRELDEAIGEGVRCAGLNAMSLKPGSIAGEK